MRPTVNAQLLIDALVRQTTLLIAQVATAGGVRTPVADLANQVFLKLAEELQEQGLSRKVSADMFGMALRTYTRKLKRLQAAQPELRQSLWQRLLDFVSEQPMTTKARITAHFSRVEAPQLSSVLRDLVASGLVFATGDGADAIYRAATSAELGSMAALANAEAHDDLAWALIYREGPLSPAELAARFRLELGEVEGMVARLEERGRITRTDQGRLQADEFVVPVRASSGWEAAVFDHFQAVVATIGQRLEALSQAGATTAQTFCETGGSTYSFDLWPGHPLAEPIVSQLASMRASLSARRAELEEFNRTAQRPAVLRQVTCYFGQCERELEPERRARATAAAESAHNEERGSG